MKRRKKRLWMVFLLFVFLFSGGFIFSWNSKQIEFTNKKTIEYGSGIHAMDLVRSVSGGTIINNPQLDTTIVGDHRIVYKVKGWIFTREIRHDVQVKDTKKPKIKFKEKEVTVAPGEEYYLYNNIDSVTDYGYGGLEYENQKNPPKGSYICRSKYNKDKKGTYKVNVIAKDMNGNTSKASYTLHVSGERVEESDNEEDVTVIDDIVLVNKTNPVPKDYKASNTDESDAALKELQAAASAAGFDIPTIVGYRSYARQEQLYNEYVARDGQEVADTYSARPGYSEHQTGLAYDVGEIDNDYGSTEAGQWLNDHCAEFGFIIRFPLGKEDITGYQYEPWHIRYVGKEAAQAIMEQGITLEEYLEGKE